MIYDDLFIETLLIASIAFLASSLFALFTSELLRHDAFLRCLSPQIWAAENRGSGLQSLGRSSADILPPEEGKF